MLFKKQSSSLFKLLANLIWHYEKSRNGLNDRSVPSCQRSSDPQRPLVLSAGDVKIKKKFKNTTGQKRSLDVHMHRLSVQLKLRRGI